MASLGRSHASMDTESSRRGRLLAEKAFREDGAANVFDGAFLYVVPCEQLAPGCHYRHHVVDHLLSLLELEAKAAAV